MQFIDLQRQYNQLKEEIDFRIKRVMEQGQFIMGPEVQELEQALSDYLDINHVICCGSGTDALQLLYMAYNVREGDAVFCPAVTFVSSVESAAMLGATPVFCDITEDTYNISPESLEKQIQKVKCAGALRPKVVVAVDFLGNPADHNSISEICRKNGMIYIEDAAQAFGSEYHNKKCGTFGDAAITSFFPSKPLGCYGDGGALFTNDDRISDVCKSLRVHGQGTSKYDNVRIGINSRMDTIQAAILAAKLKAFKDFELEQRQLIAEKYNTALQNLLITPTIPAHCLSNQAQYSLLADSAEQRDFIINKLKEAGIPSMIYYPTPLHKLKVFKDTPYNDEPLRNSEDFCQRTFSLPMHPYLTDSEIEFILETLISTLK